MELGARDSELDSELVAAVRNRLSGASAFVNARNLGLRPLLLLAPGDQSHGRTYVHDIRHAERTFFANFGEHGFLLARIDSTGSQASQWLLDWATLHVNRNELARARNGLYASLRGSNAELPEAFRDIPALALEYALGPAPSTQPQCRLASVLRHDSFELFEHERATCALTRSPRDGRFPENEQESKVLCLHKEGKFLVDTRLDKVQFALPTAGGEEVIFYEGAYSPPRISRLKLSTLALSEAPRPVAGLGEALPRTSRHIPNVPLAIYSCGSMQSPQSVWLLEEADLAKGLRLPLLESDRAWFVTDAKENDLLVDARRWTERVPPVDSLPSPRCILEAETDALCGLAILRRAVALADEILKGGLSSSEQRAHVLYAAFLGLHEIERGLGGWILDRETAGLLTLFGNEVLGKEELRALLPEAAVQRLRRRLENEAPQFRPHDDQEHALLRAQVGAREEFWNILLGSETAKGQ